MVAAGLARLVFAFRAESFGTGVLAVLIMASWPASTFWAVGTLVGVRLLFAGSSMIFMGSVGDAATQSVIDEAKQSDERVAAG